ncbi:hypothetical protein M8C21_009602 [Ambrosia artemisiifolia]|uniref:Uncharacterized protein n=1 Tax=Ambrosia artemisiifolia TaxID=4212 RepID=A0AAD5D6U3_AMBAR|nr:hypothetical protein M8C21_009602 [Ambrosia artemisiifolia]
MLQLGWLSNHNNHRKRRRKSNLKDELALHKETHLPGIKQTLDLFVLSSTVT